MEMSIGYNEIIIKYVALYLRKSRGESLEDLIKHKTVLEDLCKRKGWTFIIYEEIETGESLQYRPVMQSLLKDIDNNMYDAVICVDIDRLGRGTLGEWDYIKQIFQRTNTYIVTPSSLYNLSDDNDEFAVDLQTVFARREYKKISKRLTMGKKIGAKLGAWVNGRPPFPYVYEEWYDTETHQRHYNKKGLVVNRSQLDTYRFIVESFINDRKSCNEIAWILNKKGIPSPRGGRWSDVVIRKLLTSETHLGKIIYNKTKSVYDKNKNTKTKHHALPKEEWIVVENRHEAVKTQDEHDRILMRIKDGTSPVFHRTNNPTRLKGLVKCACCGHTMAMEYNGSNKHEYRVRKCWHIDKLGNKCPNSGGNAQYIIDAIEKKIEMYESQIREELDNCEDVSTNEIQKNIKTIMNNINKKDFALKRARIAYDEGVDTLDEYRSAKERINKEIEELENQLDIENMKLEKASSVTNHERLHYLEEFKYKLKQGNLSEREINELYKTIISSIIWYKDGNKIDIEINFL